MALQWNWDDKMGKCTTQNGINLNLYRGNAFMIAIHEFEQDGKELYSLAWFFADKDHCKNCLGLTKGYTGIEFDWQSFELDTKYKETEQFITMLAKAKQKVSITLY